VSPRAVASPPTDEAARELVELPAGAYRLGPPGDERTVRLARVGIGRYPVTNAELAAFVGETGRPVDRELAARLAAEALAGHPATGVTLADAEAYCAWAGARSGRRVRLPTGDEWEAAARGPDGRRWPWGDAFDANRCATVESGWGATVPVDAHPDGASPVGAEQMAGNVWEWVADRSPDGWVSVRGGSFLDHAEGVAAWRALPADPERATATTGLRIVVEIPETEEEA